MLLWFCLTEQWSKPRLSLQERVKGGLRHRNLVNLSSIKEGRAQVMEAPNSINAIAIMGITRRTMRLIRILFSARSAVGDIAGVCVNER